MGVGASLDELYATDDPEPKRKLRLLMAGEEQRRVVRREGSKYKAAGAEA
jgi:hypothetical protein